MTGSGILSGNRLEFLDAFFAAAKSGVILVPLGTRLTAPELAVIAADCRLSALVYSGEHADTVRELRTLVDLGRVVALDDSDDPGDLSWSDLHGSVGEADYRAGGLRPGGSLLPALHVGHDGPPEGGHHPAPHGGLERVQHGRLLAALGDTT